MQTVIGAFDNKAQAQKAVERLVKDGFDRGDVHIEQQDAGTTGTTTVGSTSTTTQTMEDHHPVGGIGHFFAHLFGTDEDDTYREHADTYHEAVRRGSSVVVVDALDDDQVERAVTCLHEAGAINVDERAQQWRKEGWTAGATASGGTGSRLRDDAPPVGKEGVLDVVQEELRVGKRALDKGGVRVIQRVSEKPVREVVRLREERAVVDRRAVDRPAEAGDMNAFREGTLEVRETTEEPVVSKTARVVEEVRVGKQVNEREETVEDRVRRKDVDVERIGGEQRERAVASNTREPLAGQRDPDAGNLSGGKPRKNDPLA